MLRAGFRSAACYRSIVVVIAAFIAARDPPDRPGARNLHQRRIGRIDEPRPRIGATGIAHRALVHDFTTPPTNDFGTKSRPTAATSDARAKLGAITAALVLAGIASSPSLAFADVANAGCPVEKVFYDPGHGQDIIVPEGFKVEVFAKGLNFPTAIAFKGSKEKFDVFVLESGRGLPSICNNNELPAFGGKVSATNPLTPDILVFDDNGVKKAGPLGKPTAAGGGFQPDGPAIGLAFEKGFQGGRLFATDSNQSLRTTGRNNSSRIVTVDPTTGAVTPFITGLPTGDHPAEQIAFKGDWIYWSQGSATNSSVVGHDNGGGTNQQEIPCQDIKLSQNLFDSGDGDLSSGYSPHGVHRPGAVVKAFESSTNNRM